MKIISLWALVAILGFGCIQPTVKAPLPLLHISKTQASAKSVQPISTADFAINDLKLGMKYSEIREQLGYPLMTETEAREYEMNYITLQYPGATIITKHHKQYPLSDSTLDRMRVFGDKYWSARGIGIGYSRAEVEAAYGEPRLSMYTNPGTLNQYVELQYSDDDGFNVLIFHVNVNTQRVEFIDMAEII